MKKIIMIAGATATGKTAFVDSVILEIQRRGLTCAVINADSGQLYAPLTLGTAKPNLDTVLCPHYLFSILTEPLLYSAASYRQAVQDLYAANQYDVLLCVGGTYFYHESSLYWSDNNTIGRIGNEEQKKIKKMREEEGDWKALCLFDSKRANMIHQNDTYRISRAVDILISGSLPSSRMLVADPVSLDFLFVDLQRTMSVLHKRIESRLAAMMEEGWLQEVSNLPLVWKDFLRKKRIIGYDLLLQVLEGALSHEKAIEGIAQQTRSYAKRQVCFAKNLKMKIKRDFGSEKVMSLLVNEGEDEGLLFGRWAYEIVQGIIH